MGKTLFDKIWDKHVVTTIAGGPSVLYIDRHFIHEVTSPQAFQSLKTRGVKVFRPKQVIATADHNIPTIDQHLPIREALSAVQVSTLIKNCAEHNIMLYGIGHPFNGIVHVVGPELGITQPGMTIVCGDSHTSTHGAFGCIAFGIGTTEIEGVFATQCVLQSKPKLMRIIINGTLQKGVLAKDVILNIISHLSANGANGYFVEFAGAVIRNLSMEGRMTICNMSIEMGARGGLIAPDNTTYAYIKNRKYAPADNWDQWVAQWQQFHSDDDAVFDKEIVIDGSRIAPMITYGTNPGMGVSIDDKIPVIAQLPIGQQEAFRDSLKYMGFRDGAFIKGTKIDYVFIGSCTNSRIEDLREVARFVKGKRKAYNVEVWVVPGSKQVERQAISEGIAEIFEAAGFKLRQPGCSACLGMNEDKIPAGSYCVSTSNRNFKGRQGVNVRTLLASPLTAAAAAILGEIADIRELIQ